MKTLVVASKNIEHRVLLDDEDFENVTKHRWFINKGYAQRACWDGKNYVNLSMHRFVMQEPEGKVIDHIDGNPLNNQKKNLRATTQAANLRNSKVAKGYTWVAKRQKWQAQIRLNYKQLFLGYFSTEAEAREAYLAARKKYWSV